MEVWREPKARVAERSGANEGSKRRESEERRGERERRKEGGKAGTRSELNPTQRANEGGAEKFG